MGFYLCKAPDTNCILMAARNGVLDQGLFGSFSEFGVLWSLCLAVYGKIHQHTFFLALYLMKDYLCLSETIQYFDHFNGLKILAKSSHKSISASLCKRI